MDKGVIWGIILVIVVGAIILFSGNTVPDSEVQPTGEDVSNGQAIPTGDDTVLLADDMIATREFTIEGSSFKYSVTEMRVKLGETIRVTFKNIEGKHDWKIDEFNVATKIIDAGEEDTIEFIADKTGTFEYYCSVGQHRELGMVGTLIVE